MELKMRFIEKIFSFKNQDSHKVLNLFGIKFKFKVNRKQPLVFDYLEVDIADNCNLNCKACTHFCSLLTSKRMMSAVNFKNDLKELAKKVTINKLRLLGGEPLLNCEIEAIIKHSREILPYSDIRICTNGLLLSKMPKSFFQACITSNVLIEISKYPISPELFLKGLEAIDENNAQLGQIYLCSKFELSLISTGNQDINSTFNKCPRRYCKTLRDGKLYRCPTGVFVERYNKYFNQNIPKDEGINIYNATVEDIRKYLNTPFETCRYCLVSNRKKINWEISKRDKNEWFADKI